MPEKNNVVVRLAVPGDVQQLADLRWRLQTSDAGKFDTKSRDRFITEFQNSILSMFGDESFCHWAAESEGQIVAVMSVVRVRKLPSPIAINRYWGYLTNCYTLPEYRNTGIGTQLISAIKDWAVHRKVEFLAVWPSDRSYPFYERSGFRRYADPLILKIDEE